jgi:hypothetical protein
VADSEADAPVQDDARIVLGTGRSRFEPLPPVGAELELEAGSQGLWHIFASVEIYGVEPNQLPLAYEVRDRASGELLTLPNEVLLSERRVLRDGDHWVRIGDRLVFDIASPSGVAGDTVEITATVMPEGEPVLSDARAVRVVDEE